MVAKSPVRFLLLVLAGILGVAAPAAPAASPGAKKGICLTTRKPEAQAWADRVAALNVSWHYSWGAARSAPEPAGVEFVPMIWSYHGPKDTFLRQIEALKAAGDQPARGTLLGFNEPDGVKQANMTVDQALEGWAYLQQTGRRLGSPAPVHADREWLQDFMRRAQAQDYRVDFICVHWYGGPDVEALVRHLERVHALYGKPIWITEFAVADWKAANRAANRHSPEVVLRFMQEVLPRLDRLDYVERYAWFTGSEDDKALGPSALFKADGTLTPLGEFYASYRSR